ncbi:MAG: glycoside hydrolase family 38 C-terminal domain-containing protein, partial [bacterium]
HQIDGALDHIAENINTKVKKGATPVLVYNPLAWERTDVVELPLPADDQQKYTVFDSKGAEIPAENIPDDCYHNKIVFVAHNVPAMGYTIYELRKKESAPLKTALRSTSHTLENPFYRLTVDTTTGWIQSIYDKINQREILAEMGNELQLFKDTPAQWDAWNIGLGERYPSRFRRVDLVESGPVRAVLRVQHDFLKPGMVKPYPTPNNPDSYFSQDIILYNDLDRIDFVTHVDWREEHVMLKVAFNVAVEDTFATYEIPFGTIQRTTLRNTDWQKARFEVSQHKWSDLTDVSQNYGVSLLNRAKYGGDIHGHVMRLSLLRSPKWPDPMADMGKHRIEYALYPHEKDWKQAHSMRKAYEYNQPLIARIVDAHKGELPRTYSFVSVSAENVVLETIKQAEPPQTFVEHANASNNVWILRLFEAYGQDTAVQITFPVPVRKAVRSNFLEEDGETLQVMRNQVTIPISALKVLTIKVWL